MVNLRTATELALSHLGDRLLRSLVRTRSSGVSVLIFHSVTREVLNRADVRPWQVLRVIELCRALDFNICSLDEAIGALKDGTVSGRMVVLSFDDGYHDFSETVAPILAHEGVCATVGVLPYYVENQVPFQFRASEGRMSMSWGELECVLSRLGSQVQVINHSYRHLDYTQMSEIQIQDDIEMAQEALQRRLGVTPRIFAYPFGRHTPSTDAVAGRYFNTLLTGTWGSNCAPADAKLMRRTAITAYDSDATLFLKLAGQPTTYRHIRAVAERFI